MPKPMKPGTKPEKKPKKAKLHGIVTAVTFDPEALTVRIKGKSATFAIAVDVAVFVNKQDAEFGDLLAGDNVFLIADLAGLVTAIDARRQDTADPTEPDLLPWRD